MADWTFEELRARHLAVMEEHRRHMRRSLLRLVLYLAFVAAIFIFALTASPAADGPTLVDGTHPLTEVTALVILVIAGMTGVLVWSERQRVRTIRQSIALMTTLYEIGRLIGRGEAAAGGLGGGSNV